MTSTRCRPDAYDYFSHVQQILNSPLTHLDIADPVRRRVRSLDDAARYVCDFKDREDSRWLFGKFETTGVEFSIRHDRKLGARPNSLKWHFPISSLGSAKTRLDLQKIFDLGNQAFKPFYAYSDVVTEISAKKKPSGAVDIRAELLGIFWMTYFNAAYVDFFGREKVDKLLNVRYENDGGATIVLAATPDLVSNGLRSQFVQALGSSSFVNVGDVLSKPPGRYALTFEQLQQYSHK